MELNVEGRFAGEEMQHVFTVPKGKMQWSSPAGFTVTQVFYEGEGGRPEGSIGVMDLLVEGRFQGEHGGDRPYRCFAFPKDRMSWSPPVFFTVTQVFYERIGASMGPAAEPAVPSSRRKSLLRRLFRRS